MSPKNFAEQLEVISRLSPRPVVTFDDGYADNLHNALPLLERYDVPAQFFVVSGVLGAETEMWWDALDLVTATESAYFECFHHLRRLSFEEQEQELDREFAARKLSRYLQAESFTFRRMFAGWTASRQGKATRSYLLAQQWADWRRLS